MVKRPKPRTSERPYGRNIVVKLLTILAILSRHDATFCITRILGSYNHIFMIFISQKLEKSPQGDGEWSPRGDKIPAR